MGDRRGSMGEEGGSVGDSRGVMGDARGFAGDGRGSNECFTRFYKVAKRRLDDISTVAAAMAIVLDSGSRVMNARFAFGGVAATPLRAIAAEEAVIGRVWNMAAVARAQAALDRTLNPISDHRGSAEYRKEAAKSLVEKFWWDLEEGA